MLRKYILTKGPTGEALPPDVRVRQEFNFSPPGMNRAIRDALGEAGFPAPERNVCVRSAG